MIQISKQTWDKIKGHYKPMTSDKQRRKTFNIPNIQQAQQNCFRLGSYSNYLTSRIMKQDKDFKGWQMDNFNNFP